MTWKIVVLAFPVCFVLSVAVPFVAAYFMLQLLFDFLLSFKPKKKNDNSQKQQKSHISELSGVGILQQVLRRTA
jgi:hypothetical protein